MDVRGPDGKIVRFPDGTPADKIDQVMSSVYTAKPASPRYTSASAAFVAGAFKPIDNAAEALSHIPYVGPAVDKFGQMLGMPSTAQTVEQGESARANNSRTGYQAIGNIVGTLPAAAAKAGLATQGAISGALLSDKKNLSGVAGDALVGAGASLGTGALLKGAASVAKPVVSKSVQILNDAGVPLTLGQIASGGKGALARTVAKGEEALTSVPFLGDIINAARERGTKGFNLALGNRALANIGEKLPKTTEAGSDMVNFVSNRLSSKYQKLTPKLQGVFDDQFQADLVKAKAATSVLPDARQKQFARIVKDVFANRSSGSQINGQALKDAESRLTTMVRQFSNSTDADQRIMAGAIDDVRQGLRGMVTRSNPQHAAELQALNKGWAQLHQLRTAANAPGNATGVVTPAQALSAARRSKFDDRFVKAAKEILPNSTPDSGTARRGAATLAAMMVGGGAGSATVSPALAVPAIGSLLYTKAGQRALKSIFFAQRPKAVQALSPVLQKLADHAPQIAPALLAAQRK